MKDINSINQDLIQFWNQAQLLDDDYKKQLVEMKDATYKDLAPAEKLYNAVAKLGQCQKVLDYGCGNAWGAIIANKEGCNDVSAVDVGKDIIEGALFYASVFNAKIDAYSINPDWLKTVADETYDGIICSNVLDVVPTETSKEIIGEIARISTQNAKIIIGLNFYMSLEMAKQRNMEMVEDRYLFVNGVLRLSSLSDEEWKDMFKPYFKVETMEYFAWPGENKETRRLFILSKLK